MSFPAYPEYKNIGIEWLGRVPKHWQVAPLKRGYTVRLGKMLQTELKSVDDVKCNYLRAANIQWSGVDISDVRSMWLSPWERNQLRLQKGDLLVSEGGDVGRSAIWEDELHECYFQNSINRVRSREYNHTKFLYYCISTIKSKGYIDIICNKSTISHFTAEKLSEIPVVFPPLEEQTAIAAFLDRETGTIDALIAEQEKLLTLLAEKRQATISHAVTRGLNPNAPMKDSGIAWLGEVPEHWEIVPIKYLVSLKSGGTPTKDNLDFWENGEIPWASAKDLKVERIFDTSNHITDLAIEAGGASLLPAGTIIIVVRGMILARIFPVVEAMVPMCINQDLKGIQGNENINNKFLAWLLRGSARESLFRLDEAGHGTKALRMDAWNSMQLPVPPIHEQIEITSFLASKTNELDQLSSSAEEGIQLLKERRSTLIAAAVTGKIDVRNTVSEVQAA
ncbi:restriction endonuclease subunit S [Gluconobacter sp. P5E10]|uniref:restriction endonuclease subunit S n=1 Tax=Gluconobacter sp. P5E10 TaxID=2762613 RepID=UPI001C057869|nr:restriction endonuclease subunit S [Gluconobacter sp. P5E10]